ncbi:MAG: phosphonate metabolism protein/1,5-bisphosphokinase (PRPP-forming) PhnN [Chromatiales bacterium]|nr:phosphonate metabolism protein/1,5-bisphosphokinase (PRPP-forming) PhnN [Gammaproteobacteria bacterium]MCP5352994.1 phosphonate metabolism protein/1,5-bisphosphokinase (PRPP-forming) PhnN [Chromatiales bacterium]
MNDHPDTTSATVGRLIYLIGPSGSGKDSLMRYARPHLAGASVVFAHRYITRTPHASDENHVALDATEFARRREAGLFAMHWRAHGLDYAVGIEIDAWRSRGLTVVVNGARRYLPALRERYPDAEVVWIVAGDELRTHRLRERAREDAGQIAARLQIRLEVEPDPGDVVISNDGPLEIAGDRLVELLDRAPVAIRVGASNGV